MNTMISRYGFDKFVDIVGFAFSVGFIDSATLTTASGILKEDYMPGIVNQVNNPNAFYAELEKSSKDIIEGKYAVIALRMGVSQALGARAELGTLPAAQRSLHVQQQVKLKFIYGTIRVSGPFLESSKTDKASFVRGMRAESEGIRDGMKLDLQRMIYGDSTGKVAGCGVSTATTVVQLAAGANMRYFEVGMLVDLLDSGNANVAITNGTGRVIGSIDTVNLTITLNGNGDPGGNVTTSATVFVVRSGNFNNELNGLNSIVSSTGTLHNIDPTVSGQQRWASYEDDNFGAFDSDSFQAAFDTVHDNSGGWPTMIISQGGPRRSYLKSLVGQRMYIAQEEPKVMKGGFKGLAYIGGEGAKEAIWTKDPYCQAGFVYGLNMDYFEFRRTKDFEFIEINGSAWIPDISGSSGVDAYKAVLACYGEICSTRRNAHMKLENVS